MELAEEDRKKKLAAGREKLAAFRKKQAHRRRTQWDGGEGDRACTTESQSNGSPKVSTSEIFFTPNDSSSVTGESDQFSLTSGDEWSAEEPEVHSSVYYHTKLASANQRIAELEEAVEGKQLALDKMVMEMQSTALGVANKNGEDRSCNESGFELKGSVLELKEALMQRDGIIRQLTSHLQWRSASEGDAYFDVPHYLQETQRLSEEVSLLQQQLCQAGETLRNQESTCQASVHALQEAKEQIVSLRFKITEKNELLKQLSQNLADKSADLLTSKSRELELVALVKELQQQAVREAEARQVMSDTAQADANRVCLLEEELEELTNQQEEMAKEFAEMQERLRNAETLCGALQKEKGEALEKIAYLEMELDRLVEDKDRAFARLSDLEEKIQDRSAIIQTSQDCDLEYGDPSERVMELEREISDLSRDHRMYIDHLNQRNAELEMLLAENLVPSRSDMSDLKNKINSQQNEILSLASQLQAAEAENAFHKVQVAELQEQLEELQKESAKEQEKHAAIRNSLEREIHVLQAGNSEYKIKLSSLEDEIVTLKQELNSSSSAVQVTVPTDSEILECEDKTVDGSGFADSTSKHLALLQKSYSNLETQFTTLLQQNSQLQSDMSDYYNLKQMHGQQESTIRDLLSQVDHLQDAAEDWTLQVQEKNYQVENLQSQLTAALKEKEELMHQISQQSEIVEKQTYSADTRVRKLESRISSLGSELTDFKEALKESETANIELQDKYDAVRCELETVKSQFAVSETRATELRSEWDLEKDQLLKNLQEKAGELEKVFAEKTGFLAAAEDAEIQHQQLLKALEAQYAEILQRNKHVLSERDQLIVSHSHETVRLEENLKQKTEELENLLLEKNQIASELSAVLAIKAEMQQQLKSQELAQTELANKHYSQKLSQAEEERVLECTKFTEELEQKAQEVLLLRAEKENLASDKESKETELNAQLQDLKQQLEEKVKELASVISEKEKAVQELALLQQLQKTEMQTLQVSLDQQIREHLQTASATENVACNWEFVRSELSNQLLVVQRKLEEKDFTSADLTPNPSPLPLEASTEARILQVNLQDGAQEMQILMAENERLIELLNSEQSATAKSRHLQTLLKQREAELVILMSEWKAKEAEHQSRESALARSLKAAQQTVKEKEALLDRKKISLQDLAASTERQDETVDKLSLELARAAEQLAVTEQLSHDVLQSKQQEVKSLESKVNQLALELASVHEERDSRMASLADQAEMFRAKEEEIVAENNSLNHQLEELKIEAQKMAEQNRAEQESMKMEMEGNKGQVHAKDLELQSLAEEMCHQKNLCELQSSSIVSLEREKEELELRLLELEKEAAEVQNDYHTQCRALQAEISELKLEREERDSRFEQEKQQLVEKSILLKDQLESATSELEQLQKDLNDRTKELESVKMDLDSMHHQKNTLQHDFAAHLEDMHAKMESREEEILALSIQLRDSTEQLKQQRAAGQEEAAAAQAELDEKNLVVASLQEELDAMRLQLEQTREDKETLKSNFDCCMEEMTQKASEQEDTIKQLQSRLAERSDIVNRDHGQLQEIYESQLSDLEHRLAMATEEIQCLENAVTLFESEKTKLQETYSNQITELEVSLQSAELEQLRVKDQMSKMAEAHEKEILDIKHSFEIQLATVEENCQTLEKALAKQDTLMVEAAVKFKQEKAEREKNFELQMSELYELSRIHETEVGRVKRQMDEMRKDHQKENQDLQQCLETQIFELENKCSIATCELDRMRSSLWTMEGDFSTEKNALEQKISELEDLCLSREKQVLELQDKFTRLNVLSEESNTSLIESHQSEIFHLEEANSHMAEEIKQLQGKLMTAREIHNQEMEALKHHQAEEISILQEPYRQIETHSQMLQSHVVPLSAQPAYVEMSSPNSEEDKLQVELTTLEGSISVFQETLTQKEQELSQLQSQVSTLASDIDRKDGEIRSLTHEVENERAKYIQLQMMYSDLECNNEQLTFSNHHMEENDEPCKERRHLPSPEKDILMAEHKQRALATTSQLQRIDHLQHKDGSHGNSVQEPAETVQQFGSVCLTSEGFEPEPDSVESLDIANMNRNSLDYFVEETDTCTTRGHRGRPRVHSLPAAVFEGFEPDLQTLSFSSEHNGKVLTSKARAQKEAKSEPASSAGCFEPEEESVQSQSEETEKVEGTFTEDSFQPESLTDAPTIVHPCFTARDQGFLPLCLDTLPASPMVIKKLTKVKDSCTQTEHLPGDSCRVLASGVCSNLANDAQSDLSADKKIEEEQSHPAPALQSAESVTGVAKETVELEVSRRLAALRSDLEERWVHKMRLQEIELHHQHDTERIEYRKQLEQQCHQQVEAAKHENYVAFVKAVRQMKKSFDQKKKHLKTAAGHQGRKPDKESREDGVESPVSTVGQAEEETLVKQLHKENQELAEVRDELLQQIAISRTQALRKTMQHELQTIVSECSKHLPPEATSDGAQVIPGLAGRHQGRVAEKIASILQRGEIKQQMAAVFQELLTLSQQSGSTSSEGSKATPYSNDASPACEGDSEATSAQQRFLEELEEMSQQSGQDLPLEWELTSATVTQADTTIGDFDHDQMGTGSVWEVFDGRCLRQDCLEVRQRYHSLFHWLVRALSLSTSTGYGGGGDGGGGDGNEPQPWHHEGEEGGECEGSAVTPWCPLSCAGCPLIDAALGAGHGFFLDAKSEGKNRGTEFSESELLGRLITVETQRIGLEQRLSSHVQLFYREREELQQRGDCLQAKCDSLEDSMWELQKKYEILEKEYTETEKHRLSLEEKCCLLEEDHQKLDRCCRLLREELECVKETNCALQHGRHSLQTDFDVQKSACNKQLETAQLEEKTGLLPAENKTLCEKCSALGAEDLVNQVKGEDSALQGKNEELKHFLDKKTAELEVKCRTLELRLKRLDASEDFSDSGIQRSLGDEETGLEECSGVSCVHQASDADIKRLLLLLERCSTLEEKIIQSKGENLILQNTFDQQQNPPFAPSLGLQEKSPSTTSLGLQEKSPSTPSLGLQEKSPSTPSLGLQEKSPSTPSVGLQEKSPSTPSLGLQEKSPSTPSLGLQEKSPSTPSLGLQEKSPSSSSLNLQEKCNFLEESIRILRERNKSLQAHCDSQAEKLHKFQSKYGLCHHLDSCLMGDGTSLQEEYSNLQKRLQLMQERNDTLQETNNTVQSTCEVLEESCRFLKKEIAALHKRNDTLEAECRALRESTTFLQEGLNASIASNTSLQEKYGMLESSVRSLQERCDYLEDVVKSLQEKCQVSEEMRAASERESSSLQQQLRCSEEELKLTKQRIQQLEEQLSQVSSETWKDSDNRHFRDEVLKLEQEVRSKEMQLAELQRNMTVLMEMQKDLKASVGKTDELNQQVKFLNSLLKKKENHILELEEKLKLLMHTHAELRKQVEDATTQCSVRPLHQTSKENVNITPGPKQSAEISRNSTRKQQRDDSEFGDESQLTSIDRQETLLSEEETRRQKLKLADLTSKKTYASSEQSLDSDSIMMSSDPDSEIVMHVDGDIMKEMKRLRRDIKQTKAVYANESALLQEALDRESLSQSRIRSTKQPVPELDASDVSTTNLPEDPEQLKELVTRLLAENKLQMKENLCLQLRIKEQEALVVEMEDGLNRSPRHPLDWQSIFERQLLLLQKQRDELLQQIRERDAGLNLLSGQVGKESTRELSLQQDKESLQEKVEELEHCHRLLQQRQAELAHCQAEKRHLEQLLLLKDETERQLMRQKRLLEEELASIESKLQEREVILVEEKARLLAELKKKDLHIFQLQTSQLPLPQYQSSPAIFGSPALECRPGHQPLSRGCTLHQSYFLQPRADVSLTPTFQPSSPDCFDGSFLDQASCKASVTGASARQASPAPEHVDSDLASGFVSLPPPRRHSTGDSGSPISQIPTEPGELHRFHVDAVERLREKLRQTDCQTSSRTGSWQHRNKLH